MFECSVKQIQVHGAAEVTATGQNGSSSESVNLKEVDDSFQMGIKIRCPCGSSLLTDSMIKCKDLQCHIWQHVACVIIPEQPLEGVPPELPDQFYCETCRLKRADPFGVSVVHPLYPVKLVPPLPTEGGNPVQNVEKTFKLTRADKSILQKSDCDLQAWCILLNDKVPFRMHWPQYAGLHINGVPIRITNRPGSQLLGMNGRDDGPAITACSREGINKISISGCDARVFCVGVRIVKRLSVQEVLSLIPKETIGEIFEEALARVCRCIGGGNTADNADGDSDVEVVADSVTVNLRCPLSGSRMKIAGRFKPCVHMGCFDLETFVELSQRSRKWQCPICLKNYSLEHIIIDPYFSRITSLMRGCGEDINEIEVKSDGSWRSKNISEHMDLSQWHYPDGSLCAATEVDMERGSKLLKHIKGVECNGNTTLNLGMKTNYSGIGGVSKLEEMLPVSSGENFENNWKKAVSLSSKATGCIKNAEDANVNQGGGGPSAFSFNYGDEFDSFSLNFNSTYCAADRVPPAAAEAALMYPDVIVISDSEEDIVHLISPEAVHEIGPSEGNEIPFSVAPHGVTDLFPEDPGFSASGSSCLGLSNYSGDDFGMPVWRLPPSPEAGHAFQLFDTNAVVQSTSVDVQRTSAPLDNNLVVTDPRLGSGSQVLGSSICHLNTEMTGGLIDNHSAFAHDDPSFQIYLSSCQAGRARQTDLSNNTDVSAMGSSEDWISLRLGGRDSHRESTSSVNEMKLPHKFTSNDGRMDCLANAASLLLSTGRDRSSKTATNKQSCGGPFSHPRQPRSIRRRLCTSRWRFG